jgi:hypothetical protein
MHLAGEVRAAAANPEQSSDLQRQQQQPADPAGFKVWSRFRVCAVVICANAGWIWLLIQQIANGPQIQQ